MRQSRELICALALTLWAVHCGNMALEIKIAKDETRYRDYMDCAIERMEATNKWLENLRNSYAMRDKKVFGYG